MQSQQQKVSLRTLHFSLTISSITYIRNLLPQSDYQIKELTYLKDKNLEIREINSGNFLPYLKACRDALEKEYLKKVIIAIKVDTQVVEIYSINMSDIIENHDSKSTQLILSSLEPLCESLKSLLPLPEYKSITMKLIIESPPTYTLPGFKDITEHKFTITGTEKGKSIKHGKMDIITIYKPEEGNCIDCPCGVNLSDGPMVECTKCKMWVHTLCAGFFSNKDKRIPEEYFCYKCQGISKEKVYEGALMRKIIAVIFNEGLTNARVISDRLSINYDVALRKLKRLHREEIILREPDPVLNIYKPLRSEISKEKVKKYFTLKIERECLAEKEIICSKNYTPC